MAVAQESKRGDESPHSKGGINARPASQVYGLTTNRLEALSDGVLAIVVTLLVLDFLDDDKSLAELAKSSNREVLAYLCGLWPHVVGYVLSFVLIVIYWILHHVMFHHIRRVDRGLLWLNALFLMTVAFLPFPADLLAECMFHQSSVIVAIYGAAHLIVGLSLAGLWLHASRGRRLLAETTDPETIRLMTRMALASPAIYTVGALVSFVSMPAGLVLYALAPAIFILPGRLDRLWLCAGQHPPSPHGQAHVGEALTELPSSLPSKLAALSTDVSRQALPT